MSFLHGVETVNIQVGPRVITAVPSSIIILNGIAPIGPVNVPTLVTSPKDAAQFGARLPGFNIPEALDSIFAHGSGIVIVINSFLSGTNFAAVTAEAVTVLNGKFKLAFAPIITAAVVTNAGTDVMILGTDYTLDDFGNGVVLNATNIPDGPITVTYKKLDASTVSNSQIIGAIDGSEVRTGMVCIDLIPTLFGFKPKLFIAPGYSAIAAISAVMTTYGTKYKGICLLDAPTGTTRGGAITGRGIAGSFGWNVSSKRNVLLFPRWNVSDPDPHAASTATILEWYSSIMAGVIARNDIDNGYWTSPSNKVMAKVLSPEKVITCSLEDSSADNQLLNAAGIVCYHVAFGTGLRTFGNRSALYPSDTIPANFISIQRVADILDDSIVAAMLPFQDEPINLATLDAVRDSVNGFIKQLIQRGALIEGSKCFLDPADNLPADLAAGHATWTNTIMGPTPLEKMTFKTFIDISLLQNIITGA